LYGRDHHRECFTFWMAGGGVRPGISYGESDDIGFEVTNNPVTVNDFHATLLHLMGVDHERLTYRFQGRDFRLTDLAGKVVKGILV
jgi:arylsulfatase A-like enzyme